MPGECSVEKNAPGDISGMLQLFRNVNPCAVAPTGADGPLLTWLFWAVQNSCYDDRHSTYRGKKVSGPAESLPLTHPFRSTRDITVSTKPCNRSGWVESTVSGNHATISCGMACTNVLQAVAYRCAAVGVLAADRPRRKTPTRLQFPKSKLCLIEHLGTMKKPITCAIAMLQNSAGLPGRIIETERFGSCTS